MIVLGWKEQCDCEGDGQQMRYRNQVVLVENQTWDRAMSFGEWYRIERSMRPGNRHEGQKW